MHVEIAGIPGSGKSTLARRLQRDLRAAGVHAQTPLEVLTGRWLAPLLDVPAIENRILELLPGNAPSGNAPGWQLAKRLVAQASRNPREQRRLLRALLRQQQVAALMQTTAPRVVLVDEGLFQFRWMLMTRLSSRLAPQAANLEIGVPDLVILTQCEPHIAQQRLANRSHPPFRDHDPAERRRLIERAAGFQSHIARAIARQTAIFPVDTTRSIPFGQVCEYVTCLWRSHSQHGQAVSSHVAAR